MWRLDLLCHVINFFFKLNSCQILFCFYVLIIIMVVLSFNVFFSYLPVIGYLGYVHYSFSYISSTTTINLVVHIPFFLILLN